ncbi:MAG: hypothetical protein OXH65_05110 [Paracoccaceae bacterium]|nr:hypothetical protein [Paracoccaceae bacterium]
MVINAPPGGDKPRGKYDKPIRATPRGQLSGTRIKEKPRKTRFHLYLPQSLVDDIDELADEQHMTRSAWITRELAIACKRQAGQ